MTLGKRTLLVIFPVILIIQLVASTTAYLTQRASLLGLEQARLEQQLSARPKLDLGMSSTGAALPKLDLGVSSPGAAAAAGPG